MAKKRKTRSQKVLADTRHSLYHLETTAQVSYPNEQKEEKQTPSAFKLNLSPATQASNMSYSYVLPDLRKTAIVTAGILIIQLVLYLALNRT